MTAITFRSTTTDPYGRGAELGRTFPSQIRNCVDAYVMLFNRAAGNEGAVDISRIGADALIQIRKVSLPLAAEIEGIAQGSGIPVEEIAAINARTEILAYVSHPNPAHGSECTTVVKLHDRPEDMISIQAWDWFEELANSWFVWEIPHASGAMTTTVTEFGIVGKIGVNSSGIGIHFNILHHEKDGLSIGAPVHVLSRAVLDTCTDINQALILLAQAAVSASSSLTLVATSADESAAISVEVNPLAVCFGLPDQDGLLIHTNHFIGAQPIGADTELTWGPDTVLRYGLLKRRLAGRSSLTVADVITAMDSHILGGGGLCCHPDSTSEPSARYQTLATVQLHPASGTLTAVAGGACQHPENRK